MDPDGDTCTVDSCEKTNIFSLSPKMVAIIVAPILAALPAFVIWGIPAIWARIGILFGGYVRRKTEGRRDMVLKTIEEDEESYAKKHKIESSGNTKRGTDNTGREGHQGHLCWSCA